MLVLYELLYHDAWSKQVYKVQRCLEAPVLVKHPTTHMPIINFDPYIFELVREVEVMWSLKLDVPAIAQIVTFCKSRLFSAYERIKYLIERLSLLRNGIPEQILPLMRSQQYKLDKCIEPGFTIITWTSLKINDFCESMTQTILEVDIFCKEVSTFKNLSVCITKNHEFTHLWEYVASVQDSKTFVNCHI